MDRLRRCLRDAARSLRATPGVTIAAVAALALGIGLNTVAFTAVNSLVLAPFPFERPDALVEVVVPPRTPPSDELELPRQVPAFDGVAAWTPRNWTVWRGEVRTRVYGNRVSPDLFRVLGVQPMLGPGFGPRDEPPAGPPQVVLSYRYWRSLSGDPAVIGTMLSLDARDHVVVGVLPADFALGVRDANVFVADRLVDGRVVARLAPAMTIAQADAAINAIVARTSEAGVPPAATPRRRVLPLSEALRSNAASTVFVVQAAVGLVFLITCANVANLLLIRGQSRRREFVIRQALGAGRPQLVRQLLVESALVAAAGGGLGVLLAAASAGAIERLLPGNISRALSAGGLAIDWRVMAFAAGVCCAAVILFGLVPAFRSSRVEIASALRAAPRGAAGRQPLGRLLVIAEITLAAVLVFAAALTLKNLWALEQRDLGFDGNGVLLTSVEVPATVTTAEARAAVFEHLLADLGGTPGVREAGLVAPQLYPFGGPLVRGARFDIAGRPGVEARAEVYSATPGYFSTVRIPLVSGRLFAAADQAGSAPVALVSAIVARRFWGDASPLGQSIRVNVADPASRWVTVIGIVGDVRNPIGAEPQPTVYVPWRQRTYPGAAVMVRTDRDAAAVAPALKPALQRVNPEGAEPQLSELATSVRAYLGPQRFSTALFATFAGLGLLVALLGVYAVMQHWVALRIPEMGVRIALGAEPVAIARLVLRQTSGAVVMGVALGVFTAILTQRALASQLHDVTPTDPAVLSAASLLLILVGVSAALVPARRATRVDPIAALRSE